MKVLVLASLVVISTLLAACGGNAAAKPTPVQQSGPSTVNLDIANFAHKSATIKVGDTIVWTNRDSTGHTVTAGGGQFKSDVLSSGQSFKQSFAQPGDLAYHCEIHPTMTGTIKVSR